ncbi:M12 family metallo-peptidase [Aureispira]|nr:M12 family metallo-peptidase [Aureispira sp.]
MFRTVFLLGCLLGATPLVFAQTGNSLWKPITKPKTLNQGEQRIKPSKAIYYAINFSTLKSYLLEAPDEVWPRQAQKIMQISLPVPEGGFRQYAIMRSSVMHPILQEKYPEIQTFTGRGVDNPRETVKLDFTPHGFHAMVLGAGPAFAIDPVFYGNTSYYMVYSKRHLSPRSDEAYTCHHHEGHNSNFKNQSEQSSFLKTSGTGNPTGTNLRVYRIAISCTGEYTQFHGGTIPLALGAMATSMNRINQVYEKDLTIRMVFIPNNDTLIFTDPITDPFPNNLGTCLNISDSLIRATIGVPNFDIGHVYTNFGGGLAAFGVCQGPKAVAGTGLSNPVGDYFDVDYVCHEIGHQFTGNHTFNYCPGQGGVPVEPGSGSTIMAYAGLCGTDNVATNSVDQFSVMSYDEIINYTHFGGGNCAQQIATGNNYPLVNAGPQGFYIPKSTPFELIGVATDADGDSLTYSWEQVDIGPNTSIVTPSGDCPLFKVNYATDIPIRVCPPMSDLVNGNTTPGEQVATYGRKMTFRMMVRDGFGGVDWDETYFHTTDTAGPFQVTYPSNTFMIWNIGSVQTVTWDVANSDKFPVNCGKVDIFLSNDGGYTYPYTLALDRDNIGAAPITVPNITGTQMRVKVKASNSIFFDISNQNFGIVAVSSPDYTISVDQPNQTICGTNSATYIIQLDTIDTFTDSINLSLFGNPVGTNFQFSQNGIQAPGTILLTISNTSGALPGNYTLNLLANSSSGSKSYPLYLKLTPDPLQAVALLGPNNGANGIGGLISFVWSTNPWAYSYELEIAKNPSFIPVEFSIQGHTTNNFTMTNLLNDGTVYYWRIRIDSSDCGSSAWSNIWSFQTMQIACNTYASTDLPISIDDVTLDTIYSTISVNDNFVISDINVTALEGVHTYVGDLMFKLASPNGTSIDLMWLLCGGHDDFDITFDDASSNPYNTIPCPPTSGLSYQPVNSLSSFNGEISSGSWVLEVRDVYAADGGALQDWELEICGPQLTPNAPSINTSVLSITKGQNGVLDFNYLNTQCDTGTGLPIYTIVSLPYNGTLLFNGIALMVGDTFSQANIDSLYISYQHDNSQTLLDYFEYTVVCPDGGYLGSQIFQINIQNPLNSTTYHSEEQLKIFPNPNTGSFTISIPERLKSPYRISLLNVLGQQFFGQKATKRKTQINLNDLPTGIYICEVRSAEDKLISEKVLILHQ